MIKIDLCGNWKVFNEKTGSFKGTVPGCVTMDLVRCGKVYGEKESSEYGSRDCIFFGRNGEKIQWIERENFVYEKKFTVGGKDGALPGTGARLVFECLDTYANISLNGIFLGRTDDMHLKYTFDVQKYLKTGSNVLQVEFLSPVKETENLPKRPAAFTAERLYSRRMQCTYGWDWVYRFVTCGIERPCYILFDDKMAVDNVYVYTRSADCESAQINAVVNIKNWEKTGYVNLEVLDPDGEPVYKKRRFVSEEAFTEYINIDDPKLWYPLGYGEQPLYTLKISVTGKGETEPEVHTEKFGIRTVKIIQKKDVPGTPSYDLCMKLKETPSGKSYDYNSEFSSFTLCINERKILCRGGNWVPCDPFISEESDKKITRLLTMAREGGFNMLRIWGGGVFEKDHFYSECDRLGILVTQDFLMACGKYPEEKHQFLERVNAEAECAALRLRNHPCLVWWSGDNENAVDGCEEMESYSGREVALKAIAPALRKYDYNRHFLPSSPYGGNKYASKTVGTTHNTQFLGTFFPYMLKGDASDFKEYYRDYLARFIAEEPSMGAVTPTTLVQFMDENMIYGDDESMWLFHTQSNPGLEKELYEYMRIFGESVLGKYKNGRDRVFKLRYLQCEWSRISMEMVRRNMFFSSGIIYWMFNDCWPAASGWAFVDYYCRPKDSFYSFKRCSGNIIASIDKEEEMLNVYLSSTEKKKKSYNLELSKINVKTGKTVWKKDLSASCEGDCAKTVYSFKNDAKENELYVLDVKKNGKTLYRTFRREGNLPIKECDDFEITEKGANYIKIKAKSYIQSVFIDGEYVFEDNCFVMLPGEEKKVSFKKNVCYGLGSKIGSPEIKVSCFTIE